jgi:[NiFe] hydrogenase diaphorase moiety large subunit
MGETTADGAITLTHTPCIGMSDQAPAALVNDVVVTQLTPERAREVVRDLRRHLDPPSWSRWWATATTRTRSCARWCATTSGSAGRCTSPSSSRARRCGVRSPDAARRGGQGGQGLAPARARRRRLPRGREVGARAQRAGRAPLGRLQRRRGRAGHLQGPRAAHRVRAHQMVEGMTIAGYAIGSDAGIIYLRGEYRYLLDYLEAVLDERRRAGLLGTTHPRHAGVRLRHPHPARGGRLHLRRGDGAHQLVRGPARRPEEPPAVPRRRRGTSTSPPS